MDKETRNLIFNTTQAVRRLLEEEFALQLEGTFDVHPDGRVAEQPGPQLTAAERLVRRRIAEVIQHRQAVGESAIESVRGFQSEAVFTFLNRLAALKMMEARGLVLPCVSHGDQSQGFKEFSGLAPGLIELPDKGYRLYLECLFDEIGREVGVLFDRTDAASQLWPRRKALEAALEKLNNPALAGVWAEDETIGWIYQYYNDPDDRKKMREESAAPRNSRELAVRNQFFTPRYVVEFLTDNTLGRIWYEMRRGCSRLKEQCRYLVRRPDEVFLGSSTSPDQADADPECIEALKLLQNASAETLPEFIEKGDATQRQRLIAWSRLVDPSPRGADSEICGDAEGLAHRYETLPTLTGRDTDTLFLVLSLIVRAAVAHNSKAVLLDGWCVVRLANEIRRRILAAREQVASQEDLLKGPVFVPYRASKDPRTIFMLDPACGSMHFGLYAFDLFEVIYSEEWENDEQFRLAMRKELLEAGLLQPSFPPPDPEAEICNRDIEHKTFLRLVPKLIIEHNLHGIDIDPRCAQIAGLSLWLRAQKTWQRLGLKPVDRPAIRRSNIVCAEPMPGEKELLREFVERQFPVAERPLFLRFLETIWEKMQLAGEAGSLLKIEAEIKSAIDEARQVTAKLAIRPRELFSNEELNRISSQPELGALEAAVSQLPSDDGALNHDFWTLVEDRIYAALREYVEQAENGGGFQRRLFAEDVGRGFAFIDVCRKRYDAVVMNPPFGEPALASTGYLQDAYPEDRNEIMACFLIRSCGLADGGGSLGALSSRTVFFNTHCENARKRFLMGEAKLSALIDLGWRVLDGAAVEAAAYCSDIRESEAPGIAIRALRDTDRALSIQERVLAISQSPGSLNEVFMVQLHLLRELPNAPLAYWISTSFLKACRSHKSMAEHEVQALKGLSSADNFRFLRLAWEPAPERIGPVGFGKGWVLIVKGGEYNPLYDDIHLVLNWSGDGRELTHSPAAAIRNAQHYGMEGLTYPYRTASGFCVRVLPGGCAFSDGGYGLISAKLDHDNLLRLAAYCHTRVPRAVLEIFLGEGGATSAEGAARNYVSRAIDEIPMPTDLGLISRHVASEWAAHMRSAFLHDETAREFCGLPRSMCEGGIRTATLRVVRAEEAAVARLLSQISEMDKAVSVDFSLAQNDLDFLDEEFGPLVTDFSENKIPDRNSLVQRYLLDKDALTRSAMEAVGARRFTSKKMYLVSRRIELLSRVFASHPKTIVRLLAEEDAINREDLLERALLWFSWVLGCSFGRWDIRYATGEQAAPELPEPFAPLPVCPPGQLQSEQGLPARSEDLPAEYPLENIPWDGILLDDPNHPLDVIEHVREVLRVIWKNRAEVVEHEACEILEVKSLRDYFRKPNGLFADHLQRYSKSRRQAPIYWPLSSRNGLYTVWLYYHRLTPDTLFTVLRDHVKPKLEYEERRAFQLRQDAGPSPSPSQRQDIAEADELVEDVRAFRAELDRVAPLFHPDLNDGVIINYAPLWQMIALPKWRKDCQAVWEELVKGDYDWAHLALHLWPERVIPKCASDRSLAIAHGFAEVFWQDDPHRPGKWIARKVPSAELQKLIAARTSPAVKASLKSLEDSPNVAGKIRRRKNG